MPAQSSSDGSVRPGIENLGRVQEILANEQYFAASSSVDLFELHGDRRYWETGLDDGKLSAKLFGKAGGAATDSKDGPELRIIFVNIEQSETREKRLNITSNMMGALCASFDVSLTFVETVFELLSWAGNAYFVHEGEHGPTRLEVFYQSTRGWNSLSQTYVSMDFIKHTTTYICVNCPPEVKDHLDKEIKTVEQYKPFLFDLILADVCLREWHIYLNKFRSQLILFENTNVDVGEKSDRGGITNNLHNLSAEWHRMIEHLADFGYRMEFFLDAHARLLRSIQNRKDRRHWLHVTSNAGEWIKFLLDGSKSCQRWAFNYKERTNLQIQLIYHLSSQADNETTSSIAVDTAAIAHETHRDSSSLITLAAVTMFFLPATFVSAIFSMSFFNFTPGSSQGSKSGETFSISKMWWLYVVVTVPLTAVVFIVWDCWRKRREAKRAFPARNDIEMGVDAN